MPVSVDVKPEYFGTWIGRLNLIEIVSQCSILIIEWLNVNSVSFL